MVLNVLTLVSFGIMLVLAVILGFRQEGDSSAKYVWGVMVFALATLVLSILKSVV